MDMAELTDAAKEALQDCIQRYNDAHYNDDDFKEATAEDYCVFLRDSGYCILRREAYLKLGQKKKKLLYSGCYYVSL